MREILFKAKRLDNGEWVEGYFAIEPNFYPVTGANNYTIRSYTFLESGEIVWTGIYKVDPNTVSQCTGLEDKNENKIFENDIIEFANGARYKIIFEDYMFKISCETHIEGLLESEFDSFEIIGNIFDNKELMEQR